MDDNPKGTPNPFSTSSIDGVRPKTTPAPTVPVTPAQQPIISGVGAAEKPDPMNRPMEKAAETTGEPVKKKKTGLIVGVVIAVLVLLGGGIAAAIILMNMKNLDPVAAAVEKIMRGESPENSKISGDVNFAINSNELPISNVKISLDSSLVAKSMINDTKANLTVSLKNMGDLNIGLNEIYTGDGNLYLKIDGVSKVLEDLGGLYTTSLQNQTTNVVDCNGTEPCNDTELEENVVIYNNGQNDPESVIMGLITNPNIINTVDDQWVRISADDFSNIPGGLSENNYASCLGGLINSVRANSNKISELYNKYPVISSTGEGVKINSKNYSVRKIVINSENLTNFLSVAQDSEVSNAFSSCLEIDSDAAISKDKVDEALANLPTIYAEIDNDKNFSRLYMEKDLGEGANMTADLSFSYPDAVNVFGPSEEEYKDLSVLIQEIFLNMYNINGYEIETTNEQ